jgi:hypothetical protein
MGILKTLFPTLTTSREGRDKRLGKLRERVAYYEALVRAKPDVKAYQDGLRIAREALAREE